MRHWGWGLRHIFLGDTIPPITDPFHLSVLPCSTCWLCLMVKLGYRSPGHHIQHDSVHQMKRDHLFPLSLLEAKRPFQDLLLQQTSSRFSLEKFHHVCISSPITGRGTRPLIRIGLDQWFSNLNMHQDHLGSLLKNRLLGSTPSTLGSVGMEWGLRIWILTSVQGRLMLLVLGPGFENCWFRLFRFISENWAQRAGNALPLRGGGYLDKIRTPSERSEGRKLGRWSIVSATEWPKKSLEETEKECVQTSEKKVRTQWRQGSHREEIQRESGQHC